MDKKLFTIMLSGEEREALEAHRVRLGCRAGTDVIRYWISGEAWRDAVPAPRRFADGLAPEVLAFVEERARLKSVDPDKWIALSVEDAKARLENGKDPLGGLVSATKGAVV